MIVLESLQMAQMVADLSALETARNERARALLQANREAEAAAAAQADTTAADTATTAASAAATAPATPQTDTPCPTTTTTTTTTASPFDSYLGRLLSPALTRAGSAHGTGINTPHAHAASDADRAHSMMALQELRAKLKQYNDSASLRQAREKVAALAAQRQAGATGGPTSDPASSSSSSARRNSQYSFPRE